MAGIVKKEIRKAFFKRIGLGILDGLKATALAPIAAPISTVIDNIKSEHGGEGKIDWVRLIMTIGSALGVVYAVYAYISGKIDAETFEKIVKLLF